MQTLGHGGKLLSVPTTKSVKPRQITICVGTLSAAIKILLDSNILKALLFHITRNPKEGSSRIGYLGSLTISELLLCDPLWIPSFVIL